MPEVPRLCLCKIFSETNTGLVTLLITAIRAADEGVRVLCR